MKKNIVVLGLIVCLGMTAGAFAADGFAGTWTIKQEYQGQERISTLTLTDDGGTWASSRGSADLTDYKVEGDTLTFTRTFNRQGQEFAIECEAKIVDGKLVGKMVTPRGEREFVATRAEETPSFFGQWDIELDFQGRIVEATLDIIDGDTLVGKWSSQRGDADLDNVKIDGGVLTFSRTMEREGQEFTLEYTAKIVEGKIDGNMSTPMGDMAFSGTQVKVEEGGEALAMVKAMDADGDGKVSEDEVPEQMKGFFTMIDANGDGGIDAEEMQMVVDYQASQGN